MTMTCDRKSAVQVTDTLDFQEQERNQEHFQLLGSLAVGIIFQEVVLKHIYTSKAHIPEKLITAESQAVYSGIPVKFPSLSQSVFGSQSSLSLQCTWGSLLCI